MSTKRMRHEIRLEIEETKNKLRELEEKLKTHGKTPELIEEKEKQEAYLERLNEEYHNLSVKKESEVRVISFGSENQQGKAGIVRLILEFLAALSVTIWLFSWIFAAQTSVDAIDFLWNYVTLNNYQVSSVSTWSNNLETLEFKMLVLNIVATVLLLLMGILFVLDREPFKALEMFVSVAILVPFSALPYLFEGETALGIIERHGLVIFSFAMAVGVIILFDTFAIPKEKRLTTGKFPKVLGLISGFSIIGSYSFVALLSFIDSETLLQDFLNYSWAIISATIVGIFFEFIRIILDQRSSL